MSYADDARDVTATLLEAGEGATCTVKVKSGETRAAGAITEQYTSHTGIPIVDVGLRTVAGPGGGLVRRQTYLIPGEPLDALSVDLSVADQLVVAGRTFAVSDELGVTATRPAPGGPTILYQVEVLG